MSHPAAEDPSAEEDRELARHVARGDVEAFNKLCDRHLPSVMAMLRSRIDSETAEDLEQELLLKLWRRPPTGANQHVRGWLFIVAKNLLVSVFRKRGKSKHFADGELEELPAPPALMDDARTSALQDCIDKLKPDFGSVVRLKLQGLAEQEIAGTLGVQQNTVSSRFSRAKQFLSECLQRKGVDA